MKYNTSIKRTAILTGLLAIFCVLLIDAQEEYTKSLQGITKVQIETGTTVKLIAGTSNELKFSNYEHDELDHDHENCDHEHHAECYDCDKNDERSKGLKAVYAGGVDNTGFGMSITQEGSVLRVKDLKTRMQRNGLQISLPKTMDLQIDCGSLGRAILVGFSSEIEVNTSVGSISLKDVTGPITAHSSTGTIEVDFSNVNQSSPITINSSTGAVDVSLPQNTKANLELYSTMGTIFTDFDLQQPSDDGMKVVGASRKIQSKLNNGGVSIVLRSSTGNIYLRKK